MSLLIVVMGLAAAAFLYALGFPGADNFRSGNWVPGPAFFQQLLAIVLFVAAGTELARTVAEKRAAPGWRDTEGKARTAAFRDWLSDWGTHNALILLAILFAFPFLLEPVGFAIMGFLAVFVITWRLQAGLAKSAAFALVSVTATMFFFKYAFFIDLPPGIWSPTANLGFFSLFR